jgi:eukaryotic-like serine/threonine-protein kinase
MRAPPTSDREPSSRRGPRSGQTIAGKYRLGDLVGKGGRGEVYRALQLDLDREVAVKLLSEDGGDAGARFLRETRIAADIHHPCAVQIFDAGVDEEGRPYCAMELLEGETLAERLDRDGALDAAEAVAIVAGLCLALQVVHDKGFLHRDVKPGNIFLSRRPDGGTDPKLIDFGIAKRVAVNEEAQQRFATLRGLGKPLATALDIIVGTPRYLSPEQIMGDALDARSDVYALAVTLYEMLAGSPPFVAENVGDLLAKIVIEPAEPLEIRAPERAIPAPLAKCVMLALSKAPEKRPASAAEFSAALWSALAEARGGEARGTEAAPAASTPSTPRAAPRRYLLAAVVAGVAVAALVVAGLRRGPPLAAPPQPAAASAPAPASTAALPGSTESLAALPDPTPAPETRPAGSASPGSGAPPRVAAPHRRRRDDLKTPY